MKQYIHEEFIRFDRKFKNDALDFYGSVSPLDRAEQKEFLKKYYEYYQSRYGADAAYRKAVSEAEARETEKSLGLIRDGIKYTAYRRKVYGRYKGWQLYTDRAEIGRGEVRLSDEGRFPLPCAKYEYDYILKRLRFAVRIGRGYRRTVFEGLVSTVTGRFIEFRKGCKEIVKLFFSPDGKFCYKDGSKKEYHYDLKKIGAYEFGEWNEIELVFHRESFSVRFAGGEHTFGYTVNEAPDTIFLGGGMQPVDEWSFRPIDCEDIHGETHDFFVAENETENGAPDEPLGEAELPFGIGTEKNKDYALVLKRGFVSRAGEKTVLSVGSLDPCGEVFINGKRVIRTDGFDPFSTDITRFVRDGANELEIVVFPRAPEVLYPWHRHKDYYNAWFCGGAEIAVGRISVSAPIEVFTERVGDGCAEFRVCLDTAGDGLEEGLEYTVTLQKSFPEKGKCVILKRGRLSGYGISDSFTAPAEPWDTEKPVLYTVSVEIAEGGELLWKGETETGFRTICQKDGGIYLNGKKIVLKGALNMQFLPPYEEVPVNHVCPENWQIVQQALAIKRMNGNCMRQHQLGYGCNDGRFAAVCDRLGVLLIWTTRLIDAVENMLWTEDWKQADAYRLQMKQVINHPSIIMWEGSNELHTDLRRLDAVYDAFVSTVKSVDLSRLICPVSHLYYGGGIYECGCKYYNTDGTRDESGNEAASSFGWLDERVVRSAHTYCLLLGYGCSWRDMATQNWKWQAELFEEKQKAYLISEFAVIGRQNPETREAEEFINKASYELDDETHALGFRFADDEWTLSQAFQALCAGAAIKQLLKNGADGMLWCCLWGGANNGSYLKSVLDFYGYKKLAYYKLAESFQDIAAFNAEPDVLYDGDYAIRPVVCGLSVGKKYSLKTEVFAETGERILEKDCAIFAQSDTVRAEKVDLSGLSDGYYVVRYTVSGEE